MKFHKPFDWLHAYSNFSYWVKKNIFEGPFRTRGDCCCSINWRCVDVHAVLPMIFSGFFILVSDLWRAYQYSRLLFLLVPFCLTYYSNRVTTRRDPEILFRITASESCICALVSFLLLALVRIPAGFICCFTSVEDIAARDILLPSSGGVQKLVQSVGGFRIFSNCTVDPVKAFPAYSRTLKVDQICKWCTGR